MTDNLENKVTVEKEALSLRMGRIMKEKGYSPQGIMWDYDLSGDRETHPKMSNLDQAIKYLKGIMIGVEKKENGFFTTRYYTQLLANISPKENDDNDCISEKNKAWIMEVYGRNNLGKMESLAKDISKEFQKPISVILQTEEDLSTDEERTIIYNLRYRKSK